MKNKRPFFLKRQHFLHFFRVGIGKSIIGGCCLIILILAVTSFYFFKRFNGPGNENIIEQALIAKSLSEGKAFTTPVFYPQSYAFMEKNHGFDIHSGKSLPDLYQAPGYPVVLAAGLKLIMKCGFENVWKLENLRFNADYFLLVVNFVFWGITCLLTYSFARMLFSVQAGVVALFCVAFSAGILEQVNSLSGVSILMTLLLLYFFLWTFLEKNRTDDPCVFSNKYYPLQSIGIGLVGGLLYLTEYTAGLVIITFSIYCFVCFRKRALFFTLGLALFSFILTISWWSWRNIELTGNPIALASQNLQLYTENSSIDPAIQKNTLDDILITSSQKLPKIVKKGLDGLEQNLTQRLWSGGTYFFSAFFLVSFLYLYQQPTINYMRRWVLITFCCLLIIQPFLNNGLSERLPIYYFSPLIIIFGCGFFLVLCESTRELAEKKIILFILIAIHCTPLIPKLTSPSSPHFTYPPYLPLALGKTIPKVTDHFPKGYSIMSDIPAGVAWYSQQSVWAQPQYFKDFLEISLVQNIGALYLSSKLLRKPYFSELLFTDGKKKNENDEIPSWKGIYATLHSTTNPPFSPFQLKKKITMDSFLLVQRSIFLKQ
jgi:hypothetical protein